MWLANDTFQDSLVIAGEVVDHHDTQIFDELPIRESWSAKCANEPYDLDVSRQILPAPYKQNSSYDIFAAVKRQREFGKKVRYPSNRRARQLISKYIWSDPGLGADRNRGPKIGLCEGLGTGQNDDSRRLISSARLMRKF